MKHPNIAQDSSTNYSFFWYVLPLISLPACVIPIGIALMAGTDFFLPYVAISILSFFANIIASIGGGGMKLLMMIYGATMAFHLAVILGGALL